MRIPCISCLRGKRGISTVLGTLIFIGILFTSVIPMYLVMRQADTLYDKKMLELKHLDEERGKEDLDVYAFPTSPTSDTLNVTVHNRCELPIRIIRLWINHTYVETSSVVQPVSETSLGPVQVVLGIGSSYDIRVTTERGNVFVSETGTLYYDEDGWEAECLAINVIITSSGIRFKIKIEKDGQTLYEEEVWKMGGSIVETYDVTASGPGTYHVTVMKKKGSDWEIVHEEDAVIEWPAGSPVVWVYA